MERSMELPGGRCVLTVKTEHRELHIYATAAGRSLRVFVPGEGELKGEGEGARANPRLKLDVRGFPWCVGCGERTVVEPRCPDCYPRDGGGGVMAQVDFDTIARVRAGIASAIQRIKEGDTDEAIRELVFADLCLLEFGPNPEPRKEPLPTAWWERGGR